MVDSMNWMLRASLIYNGFQLSKLEMKNKVGARTSPTWEGGIYGGGSVSLLYTFTLTNGESWIAKGVVYLHKFQSNLGPDYRTQFQARIDTDAASRYLKHLPRDPENFSWTDLPTPDNDYISTLQVMES